MNIDHKELVLVPLSNFSAFIFWGSGNEKWLNANPFYNLFYRNIYNLKQTKTKNRNFLSFIYLIRISRTIIIVVIRCVVTCEVILCSLCSWKVFALIFSLFKDFYKIYTLSKQPKIYFSSIVFLKQGNNINLQIFLQIIKSSDFF